MKKFIAMLTTVAMLSPFTQNLSAQEDDYYSQYRVAPFVGPTVALGVIAIAVIVAVVLTDSDNGHSHSGH